MSEKELTIMVVEDEEILLKAITTKLQLSGLLVHSFSSAEEALTSLQKSETLPDAIWLDYHLKDMDGLSFMTQIKANETWKQIPVVIVSNSASEEKVHSLLALGAKGYYLKAEHRLDDIVQIVKKLATEQV